MFSFSRLLIQNSLWPNSNYFCRVGIPCSGFQEDALEWTGIITFSILQLLLSYRSLQPWERERRINGVMCITMAFWEFLSIRLKLNQPFARNWVNWGHAEGREGAFKDEGWRHVRAVSQQKPSQPYMRVFVWQGNEWTEAKWKQDLVSPAWRFLQIKNPNFTSTFLFLFRCMLKCFWDVFCSEIVIKVARPPSRLTLH